MTSSYATDSTTNNKKPISSSPPLLLEENAMLVMDFLDVKSLTRCAQTHTEWKDLSNKSSLWNRLCQKDFHSFGGHKKDYQSHWKLEKDKHLLNLKLYVTFLDEIYMACSSAMFVIVCFIVFPFVLMSSESSLSLSRSLSFLHILICPFVFYLFTKAALFVTLLTASTSLRQCLWYLNKRKVLECIFWNSTCLVNHLQLLGMFCMAEAIPMSLYMYHFHTKNPTVRLLLCILEYIFFAGVTIHYTTKYAHKQQLLASWISIGLASVLFYLNFSQLFIIAPLGLLFLWQLMGAAFSMKKNAFTMHFLVDFCCIFYRQGFLPVFFIGLFLLNYSGSLFMCSMDFFGWIFFGPIMMKLYQIKNILEREISIN